MESISSATRGGRVTVSGVAKRVVFGVLVVALVGAAVQLAIVETRGEPTIYEECTMNGTGAGVCRFTNVDDWVGAKCGSIKLERSDDAKRFAKTGVFCSGKVSGQTTVDASFEIIGVDKLCDHNFGKSWTDVCSFTFKEWE